MFKIIMLMILINGILSKKLVPSVDSSAHKQVNLKIATDNTKTSSRSIKPDLNDLDSNDYSKTKKKNSKDYKLPGPSFNLLEKTIEINKTDPKVSNQTKHDIEPRVENLEALINISTRNNSNNNVKNEKDQIYGESIHDLIIGFHGGVLNRSELNSSKPADLDDYARWLELEKHLSKLDRFKKLHDEISDFESKTRRERYDNDDGDDRIIIENKRIKDKNLTKKLELTIQQIEHIERKKKRSDL